MLLKKGSNNYSNNSSSFNIFSIFNKSGIVEIHSCLELKSGVIVSFILLI